MTRILRTSRTRLATTRGRLVAAMPAPVGAKRCEKNEATQYRTVRARAAHASANESDDGDWCHAFVFSAGELVKRRGIATTAKLVQLMRREVERIACAPPCRSTALTLV